MKKVKLLFVVLFLSTIALTSCGKYDEGPSISLRSKTARITGEWKLVKQEYNGVDVALDADDKSMVMNIQKDGVYVLTSSYGSFTGTWEFSSDKTKFITNFVILGQTTTSEETILRLTNKELILESIEDGDKSRIELEKE